LCRAIALAANVVKLTVELEGEEPQQKTILNAVIDAQKYIKDPSTGSLEGFLALTDSIIYAIKVANPEGLSGPDSRKLKTASVCE
jgi:hypothetical protein